MPWFTWSDLGNRVRELKAQLDRIEAKLNLIPAKETAMALNLDAITAEVQRNTDLTKSILTLIKSLNDQIAAIPPSTDPQTQASLDALKTLLTNSDDEIAAAVTANTPAAPPAEGGGA